MIRLLSEACRRDLVADEVRLAARERARTAAIARAVRVRRLRSGVEPSDLDLGPELPPPRPMSFPEGIVAVPYLGKAGA